MDPSMATIMTSHQQWLLSVKQAIDNDQPIPIPPGAPALTARERDLWQTHVKQTIHTDEPITPYHWLQAQAQRRSAPTSAQIWGDVLEARIAAQAAAQDGGAA